jgi:hypothetical protein
MLDSLIASTLELREYDNRASYFIAKELALIEISLLWHPHMFDDNVARLKSLAEHVTVTFKDNDTAKELASDILHMALTLAKKAQ